MIPTYQSSPARTTQWIMMSMLFAMSVLLAPVASLFVSSIVSSPHVTTVTVTQTPMCSKRTWVGQVIFIPSHLISPVRYK